MTLRRRSLQEVNSWKEAPVAQLFVEPRSFARRQRERLLGQAYQRLLDAGLPPEVAFNKLDSDADGELAAADFAAAGRVGITMPAELLLRLFETVDTARRGLISLEEWTTAFEVTRPPAVLPGGGLEPLPPPEAVPLDVLRSIVIELVNHSSFTPVWTSEGMLCRKHVSIWAPDQLVAGIVRVTALKISVGHYANQGFSDARAGSAYGVGRRTILQVRDRRAFRGYSSQAYLQAVADHYCPRPTKYRQVWSQSRGRSLFVWRPVPPSDAFVALGMVATTTPEPPPLEEARCVPKAFCRPGAQAPAHLWDDSGSGGKPGSIWLVNSSQVLWAAVGHCPPHETAWELATESISFDYTGRPSVHVLHEPLVAESARDAEKEEVSKSSWSLTNLFAAQ